MDVDSPMPFGYHEGKSISEVPSNYLRWILENVTNRPELLKVVETEMEYRDRHDKHFED